jgi:lipopolysaccharide biosynthesis protein
VQTVLAQIPDAGMQAGDLVLKIHSKKSLHRTDGDAWRNDMLDKLLAPAVAERVFRAFASNADLGMVVPDGHALSVHKYMGQNQDAFQTLLERLPHSQTAKEPHLFAGGAMFYARAEALTPLLALQLNSGDFEAEAQQLDGTMAHAVERLMGASVTAAGLFIAVASDPSKDAVESSSRFNPV